MEKTSAIPKEMDADGECIAGTGKLIRFFDFLL